MNIYSCVDGNNIDKIIILFNSVFLNTKCQDSLKFYLLVDFIPEELPYIPNYLKEILTIKKLEIDNRWKELLKNFNEHFYKQSSWCNNNMNFARFLFFKNFPEVDRVIYLDWDMIVLADIFEIKEEYNNFKKIVIAECGNQNIINNIFKTEFIMKKDYLAIISRNKNILKTHQIPKVLNFLNIDYNDVLKNNGFNAGFYIVSNIHFEEEYLINLISNLINVQKKLNCFNFGTQVVMNLMHVDNRLFIDKIWNHLPNLNDNSKLKIIHWNGKDKPWKNKEYSSKIWFEYCNIIYPNFSIKSKKENKNLVSENTLKSNKKLINNPLIIHLMKK